MATITTVLPTIATAEPREPLSVQDQLAAMMELLQGTSARLAAVEATKGKAKPNATKAPAKAAPVAAAKAPKPEKTGQWHLDALNRTDREGKPFYAVDLPSLKVHGNVALVKSNKWGPVLMLVNGKRKPIYLRAEHLDALIQAHGLLQAFAAENEEYLLRSMEKGSDDE